MAKSTKTTKEFVELGWFKAPLAMRGYLANPALQEQYPTFDAYALASYQASRSTWGSGNPTPIEPTKGSISGLKGYSSVDYGQPTPSYASQPSEAIGANYAENSPTEPGSSLDLSSGVLEQINDKYSGLKVKKLKLKKKRNLNNARITNTVCPNCLSTLKINEVGVWECSKDKLYLWQREFLIYNKLNEQQKNKYLLIYSDPSMFLDLHAKWDYIDSFGNRPNFDCGYSNKLFNPIGSYKTYLADPVFVKTIERSLGRELTEEELIGDKELWKGEGAYFEDYKKGRLRVKIPKIAFPSDIV